MGVSAASADGDSVILTWALWYEEHGLSVVPTKPGEKRPGPEWEPFQKRRANPAEIRAWLEGLYADSGIGVIPGSISGNVFAVDVDCGDSKYGIDTWDELILTHGDLPHTWVAKTGGGGRHYYFRAPQGVRIKTAKNTLGLHVDTRGEGGFLVLPPSPHPSGSSYEWLEGSGPGDVEIADAPEWLLDLCRDRDPLADFKASLGTSQSQVRPSVSQVPPSSDQVADGFGRLLDGREEYMRNLVWARMIEERRDCGDASPTEEQLQGIFNECWEVYARHVKARGASLEHDGRGQAEMTAKIRYAARKWDGKLAYEAANPRENRTEWKSYKEKQGGKFDSQPDQNYPLVLTAAQFVAGFTPPEYLVDGVLQRGYLYGLTARTGHGKTAFCMYGAQSIAFGREIHKRRTLQGSVLYLAGENPDDIRARYLVLADHFRFDPATAPINFIAGVVSLADAMPRVRAELGTVGDIRMVVVDTAAAYFRGDDGNSNAQQGEYARLLRQLTTLPGLPAVMVASHPVKNAAKDNLLPAGGGAFLNELDGNLTLWANGPEHVELHWQGKFRGPEFDPMLFKMVTVTSDSVKDREGRLMPSVVAEPISDFEADMTAKQTETDENRVLHAIGMNANRSQRELCRLLGWENDKGKPNTAKVNRTIRSLLNDKLVAPHRNGKVVLTAKGKRELGWEKGDE